MKIDELNKFSVTLFLLPCIPAFLLHKHSQEMIALQVLFVFWILSAICFLKKPFAQKFKNTLETIGNFTGKYIAIIILALGYIIAVIPTGILMKIVRRDRLKIKKPNCETYWLEYNNKDTDYEYQF